MLRKLLGTGLLLETLAGCTKLEGRECSTDGECGEGGLCDTAQGLCYAKDVEEPDGGSCSPACPEYEACVRGSCRPRFTGLFGPRGDRLIGVFAILLAVCVIIPLPGTNLVPSIALVVVAIAIMQEDGVMLGIGTLLGLAGVAYTVTISWALVGLALFGLRRAIGF